jgi:hypothetical protein
VLSEKEELSQRLTRIGFGLGPYAFQQKMEIQLREAPTVDQFCQYMRSQFVELKVLSNKDLDDLYEICIQARVERSVIEKGRKVMSQSQWKRSILRLRRLTATLRKSEAIKVETRLREALGNTGPSQSEEFADELSKRLWELTRICSWWEGLAASDKWKKYYAGYIWQMNLYLVGKVRTESDRADIIAHVLRWMKVEARVSKDAILRSLTRERAKPRRFVFRGDDEFFNEVDKRLGKQLP